MRRRPSPVRATFVLGFLRTKRFSMATSPASSSLLRWLERLPLVKPVARSRKTKSASVTEESTVRIARRPGSWMRRSRTSSSASCDIAVLVVDGAGRPEGVHEEAVVEEPADDDGRAAQQQPDVARVRAVPHRQRTGHEEGPPDDQVVDPEADADRVGREHDEREADRDGVDREVERPAGVAAQERRAAEHERHRQDEPDARADLLARRRREAPVGVVVVAIDRRGDGREREGYEEEDPGVAQRADLPVAQRRQDEQPTERDVEQSAQVGVVRGGRLELSALHGSVSPQTSLPRRPYAKAEPGSTSLRDKPPIGPVPQLPSADSRWTSRATPRSSRSASPS